MFTWTVSDTLLCFEAFVDSCLTELLEIELFDYLTMCI